MGDRRIRGMRAGWVGLALALVSVGCATSTIPGTSVTATGFVTYTEFVDGVPVIEEHTQATFTSEQSNPFYNLDGSKTFYDSVVFMRPHEVIAGQAGPGTWKLLLSLEYKGSGTDNSHSEATSTVWPPDRSYQLTGFDGYVDWSWIPECNDGDGHIRWITQRTIDEHTTARLAFHIC